MMLEGLADLDELLLACRGARSRTCLTEAVLCYRVGALRSATVATWNALVYDYLDKLRELSLADDDAARTELESLAEMAAQEDKQGLMRFEREWLTRAESVHQLLTAQELDELQRIRDDRHRSAHPVLGPDDDPYAPSPEQVRAHIRNAVSHMLARGPVQGKRALDGLMRDLQSSLFPTDRAKARVVLHDGPLRRPTPGLLRNYIVLVLKRAILEDDAAPHRPKYAAALGAVAAMFPESVARLLGEELPRIVDRAEQAHYAGLVGLAAAVEAVWPAMGQAAQVKASAYVSDMPPADFPTTIHAALDTAGLCGAARQRVADAAEGELRGAVEAEPRPEFADGCIAFFSESGSFDGADARFVSLIQPVARLMSRGQLARLLHVSSENNQIWGRGKFAASMDVLRRLASVGPDGFEAMVRELSWSTWALDPSWFSDQPAPDAGPPAEDRP